MQTPKITGADFDDKRDGKRLSLQYLGIFNLMRDGRWRTLREISDATGAPESSVSAQLRHMRKAVNGGHTLNKRYVLNGLYEYQLIERTGEPVQGDLF